MLEVLEYDNLYDLQTDLIDLTKRLHNHLKKDVYIEVSLNTLTIEVEILDPQDCESNQLSEVID